VVGRPLPLLAALFGCLGLLAACRGGSRVSGDLDAGAGADALRDDARLILERHCGACHVRDYPTALPGALAVYDLRERDWSVRMSDAQLHSAEWRLGEPLPPEGSTNDVTPEERARFTRYVEAELARRGRSDSGR
jgi:mono/diheme cytochrome c family protein